MNILIHTTHFVIRDSLRHNYEGFTWRSHYVLYLLPPLFCTIMPYTHKFTPTFSEMASHPHIHPHTCTQTPPIHLHTHPHRIQLVTDCRVRSRHSLDSYNFPVNLMPWVSVEGILHCKKRCAKIAHLGVLSECLPKQHTFCCAIYWCAITTHVLCAKVAQLCVL